MKRLYAIAACSLMLLLGATQAAATIIVYNILLSGTESVPANASTATGSATVTVDDIADSVAVVLSFTGLIGGPASAAHIHCCVATNANGPVVIPFTGFPNTTSGTYSNTLRASALQISLALRPDWRTSTFMTQCSQAARSEETSWRPCPNQVR